MERTTLSDPFLAGYLTKYDQWMEDGKLSHAARVIPIAESIQAQQWVMPRSQVMEILQKAQSVALWPCVCRSHYQRCDKPLEVCFILNKVADSCVAKGLARSVSLEEATEVLQKANEHGLVHMGLYMPDHELVGLCSCCTCCCHELQILQKLGRRDRLARSEYVAVNEMDNCTHCGACADRCAFGARSFLDDRLVFQDDSCFGCGLCITVCPTGAIAMTVQK